MSGRLPVRLTAETATSMIPSMELAKAVEGHLWTVGALLRRNLSGAPAPPSRAWTQPIEDPVTGSVRLHGRLAMPRGADCLAILVHGLGGTADSAYMASLANAATALGIASLRLHLRGADGSELDLYHGGLTEDLHTVAASPALASFRHLVVAGLSLGGHLALRFASESGDPRLRAVAAVSSPLDLAVGVEAIDRPTMAPYRRYLLRGLKEHGRRLAVAGILATPVEKLEGVRRIREWDELTVVPRFGFADTADYYRRASVAGRLEGLRVPALLVAAQADPMVPPAAVTAAFGGSTAPPRESRMSLRWVMRGGHLGFPRDLSLGVMGEPGLDRQLLSWLLEQVPGAPDRSHTAGVVP